MEVAIICNGEFPRREYPRHIISRAGFIICCDGALKPFLHASPKIFGALREPDLVIGDLDSLPASLRETYASRIVHVAEQDDNDMTKAFRWAMDNLKDISSVHFLGAGGKREDHTVGNLSLLMEYTRMYDLEERGVRIEMVSDYTTAFPVCDSVEFWPGKGRQVSIFSPDNTLSITSEGLEYQTSSVVFDNWWKATLNKSIDDRVFLRFSHRSLALIILD